MPVIEKLRRPRTVQELREAIYHLLNDHFESIAMIDLQNHIAIEYRDNGDGDDAVEADIAIIDFDRHSRAWLEFKKWADDAPPDDYLAEAARLEAVELEAIEPPAFSISDDERVTIELCRRNRIDLADVVAQFRRLEEVDPVHVELDLAASPPPEPVKKPGRKRKATG